LLLTNKTALKLKCFFGQNADSLPGETIYTLEANSDLQVQNDEKILPPAKFLIFINENPTEAKVAIKKL